MSTRFSVPDGDAAVLLNANAGRVRRAVARRIRRAAPDAILFWTRSLEEAEDAVEAALESEVSVVFAGGGDGTIIDVANRLARYERRPRLGILKMGTGNALATWAGARSPVEDLRGWATGEAFGEFPMRFVAAERELFPFAGLGWDAAVLNDYRWAKEQIEKTPLERFSSSVAVYIGAAFGRTAPRYAVASRAPQATVTVLEGEAWRVDRHGSRVGEVVPEGGILYQGPAHITAFGTTPYYGYAMKILPHACLLDSHLHLRIAAFSVATALNELPRIWTGEFEHEKLYDFLVRRVRVAFDEPVPYQVGGDARGMRQELEIGLSPCTQQVLSFAASREA